MRILIATVLAKGVFISYLVDLQDNLTAPSILEYLSREDADRAVKELDGKDLRGNSVRVTLDDSVSVPYFG